MAEVQAETRKVKIDKEFIVKIKGEIETDMTDEKIKWCFDTMDKELEDIIRKEIIEEVSVKAIVRCKDCQHYDKNYHNCNLHSEEPDQYSTGFYFRMNEDDYCSYGERKEKI